MACSFRDGLGVLVGALVTGRGRSAIGGWDQFGEEFLDSPVDLVNDRSDLLDWEPGGVL
jgi:hypothetical protein